MVYQFAPVGGGYSPVDACDKFSLPFQHPGNGFFHHLCSGFAFAGGKLLKLRGGIGGEMDFHALNRKERWSICQSASQAVGLEAPFLPVSSPADSSPA